jgi:hypothetical protein
VLDVRKEVKISMTRFIPLSLRRCPRVNLAGKIPVTVQLENGRYLPAKLHRLSITGGLLELVTCLDEHSQIRLTIPFDSGEVHAKAEILFPMWSVMGYLQPFCFTDVSEADLQVLDREITSLLRQNIAPATTARKTGFRPARFPLEPS